MIGGDGSRPAPRGYALLESSKVQGGAAPAAGELAAGGGITSQSVNPANRKTRVSVRVRCQGPTVRHNACNICACMRAVHDTSTNY